MIDDRSALTDHGNERAREALLAVAERALRAVHPDETVPSAVRIERADGDDGLVVDGERYDLDAVGDVFVLGAGKGSVAVAEALLAVLDGAVAVTDGIVAEKAGQERPLPGSVDVVGAGHPLPDAASRSAGERALELAAAAGPDDLVFACVTGGASAQLVAPASGLAVDDLAATTDRLLRAGLPIEEINAVRKHLSRLKGGRLAAAAAPATAITLVVVDEVGGAPWGPTVGDPSTPADAVDVLRRRGLWDEVPGAVREHLAAARERAGTGSEPGAARATDAAAGGAGSDGAGVGAEVETFAGAPGRTPAPGTVAALPGQRVVLADATDLCEAAAAAAADRGYDPLVLSARIEGESREVGTALAGIAEEAALRGRPAEPPCVIVSGGETTVTVESEGDGEGGPNQELAVSVARRIAGDDAITALALGTDGTDGPTDVAGGLVDGTTVPRLRERGGDPLDALRRHDAAAALRRAGDAVSTGPTGTNVMDLRLFAVEE